MSPFDPFDEGYKNAYRQNVDDAPRAARAGELNKKIGNFCELHGFAKEEVMAAIQSSRIVAACFAKDPNKQNYREKDAAKRISEMKGVCFFKDSQKNPLVVVNGGVMSKAKFREAGGEADAKTIDFQWKYGNCQFYAYHKYTKESGGSQDNQYNDMKAFIDAANRTIATNTFFIAIADGAYYEGMDGSAKKTRMERLVERSNKDTVRACNIEQLEELMKKLTSSS